MNLHSGLKRIYVVLAALWGVSWLVFLVGAFHEIRLNREDEQLIIFGIIGVAVLASPLVYLALVGLTKVVAWIVAGFKTEPSQS